MAIYQASISAGVWIAIKAGKHAILTSGLVGVGLFMVIGLAWYITFYLYPIMCFAWMLLAYVSYQFAQHAKEEAIKALFNGMMRDTVP